jgi:hypothetical protein
MNSDITRLWKEIAVDDFKAFSWQVYVRAEINSEEYYTDCWYTTEDISLGPLLPYYEAMWLKFGASCYSPADQSAEAEHFGNKIRIVHVSFNCHSQKSRSETKRGNPRRAYSLQLFQSPTDHIYLSLFVFISLTFSSTFFDSLFNGFLYRSLWLIKFIVIKYFCMSRGNTSNHKHDNYANLWAYV